MCSAGWIQGGACTDPKVTYETTDNEYRCHIGGGAGFDLKGLEVSVAGLCHCGPTIRSSGTHLPLGLHPGSHA